MPFSYNLPIPTLEEPQPETVRLDRWLVDEGAEVHRGTRVAILETKIGRYAVITNGDGVLRTRLFPAGAKIESFSALAVIFADGENIPYDRAYSLAEELCDE
jgi:pyruvate/2-oxoglutarate dehydrogenase complex dihydrolipoamide acyltransferase (E2) component